MCGGTLVNHYKIITAAHCITDVYTYINNGQNIRRLLKPTTIYPTIESRLLVYLGLHSISNLQFNPKHSAVAFEVSKINIVIIKIYFFK